MKNNFHTNYLLGFLDNLKDLPNRILLKNIFNNTILTKQINADEIVYNSIYFRYYNQPIIGAPEEIGGSEFILLTINFNSNLTEEHKPIEGEHKIEHGFQFLAVSNISKIYFRQFIWSAQKYEKWKVINSSNLPI